MLACAPRDLVVRQATCKGLGATTTGLWTRAADDVERNQARLSRLLQLGLPAASQVVAEVGVFALATALAGTLDPISSASHQIALNLAGLSFMVPLGLGSAGAVHVGHAVGADDPSAALRPGWMAILLGTGFMVASRVALCRDAAGADRPVHDRRLGVRGGRFAAAALPPCSSCSTAFKE